MLYFSRFKMTLIWVAVAIAGVLDAPSLFAAGPLAKQPDWIPKLHMAVGLDQQGGSHILLSLDLDDLIRGRLETTRDEVRSLLRSARIGYTGLARSGRTVQVLISDTTQVDAAKTALKTLTDLVAAAGALQEVTVDESEPGLLKFTVTDASIKRHISTALAQSIEVIKRRLYELGIAEPIVHQQGDDRILVQVSGLEDPERLNEILGRTAKLTIQMIDHSMTVQDALSDRPPAGSSVLYSQDDPPVPYLIEDRVIVSGENLLDAQATYNSQTDEPVVSFTLDSKGAERLGRATSQNVGKLIAIVFDDQVISAPLIREPILGGAGQISGNFTAQNAKDIAVLLRAGPLPARLTIVEESPMAAPK
ncbi:hypothetical protein NKH73_29560 [Mesorhizobium sp. M0938]